jgi:GxxExxY protein
MKNENGPSYSSDFLFPAETENTLGSAMAVLNSLGHGYLEKVYELALCVEFRSRRISFEQQRRFVVSYRSVSVGEYIPDLIAFQNIVIETKTIERIGPSEIGQMLNYLKVTGCHVGLILNFKRPRLEWQRVVFSPSA